MTVKYPSWNEVSDSGGVADEEDVHVVGSQEGGEHENIGGSRELIFGWVV